MVAGIREESGELYVMREEGGIMSRSFQRRPEEDRWNQEELQSAKGLPWEPTPEAKGVEAKSQFRYRDEEEDIQKDGTTSANVENSKAVVIKPN